MPATAAAVSKKLKTFGLSLPGTQPKAPWPGHDDIAVNNKTFTSLSEHDSGLSISVKLPLSRETALLVPGAKPTGYGLGKRGWVSLRYPAQALPELEPLMRWMLESYQALAPKRLVKQLEAEQAWTRAGGLPAARKLR